MCMSRFAWDGMVNPARAGMILVSSLPVQNMTGKPRACGDDPKFTYYSLDGIL